MIATDQGVEVYENDIEFYFKQFFEDRGIDLEHDTVKQTKFNAAWKYIYNNLFKPDINTVRYNNKNSKIDYSDIHVLNNICDIYIDLCFEYNIMTGQYGFSRLTGISRDTLNSWKRGEYRGNIKGNGDEILGLTHSDIVKKIDNLYTEMHKNNLDDTTVGQITMANNDEDVGLMYAQKAAQAQANAWLTPTERPQQIAQRRAGERPELPG